MPGYVWYYDTIIVVGFMAILLAIVVIADRKKPKQLRGATRIR